MLAACGPTPRNQGSPTGQSREQDQKGEAPLDLASEMPEAGKNAFSVLAANVGNLDVFRCDSAIYKLCAADQEQRIADRIARLKPDIALLSEVLAPEQCAGIANPPPWHVCAVHPDGDQARRLLGDDYTIACEPRRGYECIGIRKAFAELEECKAGQLCRGALRSVPPVAGCDDGFTLAAATARIDGERVDLLVGHPPSGFMAENAACRRAYLPGALAPRGEEGSLRDAPRALFGGDLNLDPWRTPSDPDTAYFRERVRLDGKSTAPFAAHSGPVEHDPPYWTSVLIRKTLDHVVSEGLTGRCLTLGAAPSAPALDLQLGAELERLDHLAQYCVLSL